MPPATLAAYKDHGNPEPRLAKDVDDARHVMDQLAEVGVGMDSVTKKLEDDGVASFAKSFDSLIAVVEKRRIQALGTREATPKRKAPRARKRQAAKRTASSRKTRARGSAAKKSTSSNTRKSAPRKKRAAVAKKTSGAKARRKPLRTARRSSSKRKKRR
jgi:Transaldolase/Fructose-6-phosphate aldolase